MLVYTFFQRFEVEPDALDRIAREWLLRKLRRTRPLLAAETGWSVRGQAGLGVESVGRLGDWVAYRLTHPDSEVSGRLWRVHIGIRGAEQGGAEASVVTEISDISPLHVTQPELRRPLLVSEWLSQFAPAMLPAAPAVLSSDADLQQLLGAAYDTSRLHPIIVVSHPANGFPPIELDDLRDRLDGQAQWVEVSPTFDTRAPDYAQERWAVWRGGLSFILTPMRDRINGDGMFLPVERYTPDALDQLSASGIDVVNYLQQRFQHRTNLQIARVQIGPDQLERARIQAEQRTLLSKLAQGPTISPAEIDRIRGALESADAGAREAERAFYDAVMRADEQERLADAAEQRAREAELRANALSAQIDKIKAAQNQRFSLDPTVRDAFVRRMGGEPLCPEQTLRLLAYMFPDRIVVLDSAYRSAHEARLFEKPEKVIERLMRLTLDYVDAMRDGQGDGAGIKIFGSDGYAAKESESTGSRASAVKRRTFVYMGHDLYMCRHIKIGVKRSAEGGWRCHFEWLPDEGRVVIGHCGKHLDMD